LSNIFHDPRVYVTPSQLPPEAEHWQRQEKAIGRIVFAKAIEKQSAHCLNCMDLGEVYLTVCTSGPYDGWPSGAKATYFPGSEQHGEGIYIVRETRTFLCPACQGKPGEELEVDLPASPHWTEW